MLDVVFFVCLCVFFFFKQKTAYEMRISDWSSDVCSSDLLEKDEVGQIRMPNPNDPYRGLGPVQSLLSILVGQRAALDYNRNFFINGAGPGGITEFPEELDDDEWRRFKPRWDSSPQGVASSEERRVGKE